MVQIQPLHDEHGICSCYKTSSSIRNRIIGQYYLQIQAHNKIFPLGGRGDMPPTPLPFPLEGEHASALFTVLQPQATGLVTYVYGPPYNFFALLYP